MAMFGSWVLEGKEMLRSFNVIGVKSVKVAYQLLKFYMAI
jgi:hypothetical protein